MRRPVARILPVAAGALAFLLTFTAMSGAASGPAAAQPAPPTLSVPLAKAGDKALYSQEVVGHNGRTPDGHFTSIEHGPTPWMALEMLDVSEHGAAEGPRREYAVRVTQYDMAKRDGTPLRTHTVLLDGGRVAEPMPTGEARPGDGADGGSAFGGGAPLAWDCMVWSLANGRTVDLAESAVLYDGCDIWTAGSYGEGGGGVAMQGSGGLDRRHAFRALGLDTVGGLPAVVLRHDWAGSYALVWMSEQVPYPLIVVMGEKAGPYGEGPQMVTYRLERFEAGDGMPRVEALRQVPQRTDTLPSDLELVPAEPWGLAESGTTMPFPASEAWAFAQRQQTASDWTRRHPDAAAVQVDATHAVEPGPGLRTERLEWRFTVDDGQASETLRVVRTQRFLESPDGTLAPVDGRTELAGRETGPSAFAGETLPTELPSLASLERMWRDRLRPDAANATLDHWSLWLTRDTGRLDWNVAAGHDLDVAATPVAAGHEDASLLVVEASGRQVQAAGASEAPAPAEAMPPFDTAGASLQSASAIDESAWRKPVAVAAASGAGLLAAAVTAWLAWKPSVVGVALFSRIQESRLLDHPVRRRIVDAVAAQPGIHGAELVRRVGAARGSVAHHVAKLVAAGHLVETQVGKYACYRLPTTRAAAPPGSAHVLEAVRAMPGASAAELARRLELTPATVHYHLQKLRAAGLLDPHAGPGLWAVGAKAEQAA